MIWQWMPPASMMSEKWQIVTSSVTSWMNYVTWEISRKCSRQCDSKDSLTFFLACNTPKYVNSLHILYMVPSLKDSNFHRAIIFFQCDPHRWKSRNNFGVNRRDLTISHNAIAQFAMTVITGKRESDMWFTESVTFDLRKSWSAAAVWFCVTRVRVMNVTAAMGCFLSVCRKDHEYHMQLIDVSICISMKYEASGRF